MKLKNFLEKIKQQNRKNLTEQESRFVLSFYKIKTVKGEIATSLDQAIEIAEGIGYPVAIKILSKDIIHKTDVGGVSLNIKSSSELTVEYNKIIQNVKRRLPFASINGVFVQQMVTNGYELILGAKKDQVFGPTIMLGLGGVYVEALDDISFRIAPINKKDVLDMINETKIGKIIKGFRGKAANINALIDSAINLSRLVVENPQISEVDINPLMVGEDAIALDARIFIE
ncbi:MAG: acetate--CoA ligase family protein [Candidatus Aenigmatarchaeota archaeon]